MRRGSGFRGRRRSWVIHDVNIENVDFLFFFVLSPLSFRLRFIGRSWKNSTTIERRRFTFNTRRGQ